uniref:ORF10 n=1 Tax=Nitrosopumilaceae spindle-shaped virus TaxID=3065433 RepID=A0AAT9J7K2_9VIRU
MWMPDWVTWLQVSVAMGGLFIAGYFAKKKQAAKRYKELQKLKADAEEQGRRKAEEELRKKGQTPSPDTTKL